MADSGGKGLDLLGRVANIASIANKAEKRLLEHKYPDQVRAHPRLVGEIVENGSWIEDELVQGMWAGLLASSCSESGDDDSNLIFITLLKGLSKLQARILEYACREASLSSSRPWQFPVFSRRGWSQAVPFQQELLKIAM
jgi:hypothetical protein